MQSLSTFLLKNYVTVIVLEKRSNFAVKLILQYEPLKTGTLIDFVHDSECLNECNSVQNSEQPSYSTLTVNKLTDSAQVILS